MSYPRIPYVHSIGKTRAGLGQVGPVGPVPPPAPATQPTDPLWARIAAAFGTPVVSAVSSRIAYGQTYAPYPGTFYGGTQTPYGAGGYGVGGFLSPQILLIGGAAILAMMLMRK